MNICFVYRRSFGEHYCFGTFEYAVKKSKCTDNKFSLSFYTHAREAESTHSECEQHMEIVNISAEGRESDWCARKILLFTVSVGNC